MAIKSLKSGKTPGIDNIPGILIKSDGSIMTIIFRELYHQIWENKVWPKSWTSSLVIPIPKKGNLKINSNYRTLSMINHPSNILLNRVIFMSGPVCLPDPYLM